MTFERKKMEFLTMDKIFVLDNFKIVLDKKHFVRADGRGNSQKFETTSFETLRFVKKDVNIMIAIIHYLKDNICKADEFGLRSLR